MLCNTHVNQYNFTVSDECYLGFYISHINQIITELVPYFGLYHLEERQLQLASLVPWQTP